MASGLNIQLRTILIVVGILGLSDYSAARPIIPGGVTRLEWIRCGNPISTSARLPAQAMAIAETEERGFVMTGLRVLGVFLLVLSLFFAAAFMLRKYLSGQFGTAGKRKWIQILETVSLGEKRNLNIVKVGGDHLLIGCTSSSISVLERIPVPGVEFLTEEVSGSTPAHGMQAAEKSLPQRFLQVAKSLSSGWGTSMVGSGRHGAMKRLPRSPSFREILEVRHKENSDLRHREPSQVVSRLAEIRRNLRN